MNIRGTYFHAVALAAASLFAASAPPLAGEWNILPTGSAASSGDLLFRITRGDGSDPVEIEVPVMAGASDRAVAGNIRRALGAHLPNDRYRVVQGEGANVLVRDPRGKPNFSIELVTSDVDNLRVAVRSVAPAASPTVRPQAEPTPEPGVPPPAPANAPGDVVPPPEMRVPNQLPNVTPPTPESPPGEATPPADTRAPRAPPDDMPVPGNTPAIPDPNGIPVPSPATPVPAPAPVPSPETPKPAKPPPQKPPV
jgi:hypothetical protein